MEALEVDVVCGVDGLGSAEDGVGDGDTTAEEGVVFDVVDKEGRGVEHADYLCDNLEAGRGDLEPGIEPSNEVSADIFAGVVHHIVEGSEKDLLFL